MKRFLESLPSAKFMTVTVVVCLVLGVIFAGGFYPKALLGLLFALLYVALITFRNSDPAAWEAYHEPVAHSLRVERDEVATQLRVLLNAYDNGDPAIIAIQTAEARKLLTSLSPKQVSQ